MHGVCGFGNIRMDLLDDQTWYFQAQELQCSLMAIFGMAGGSPNGRINSANIGGRR